MKITIYELLGLIKEGKAPNHIRYNNEDWYWGYDTYIPEEYSIGTGTAAPKLLSTIGKQITWKYYRKFPNYFETDIKIEISWILNFHKELHQYFITCIEEQIQNQKAKVRKANRELENLYSTIRLANQQREWYEDGYTKYLKVQSKNG